VSKLLLNINVENAAGETVTIQSHPRSGQHVNIQDQKSLFSSGFAVS